MAVMLRGVHRRVLVGALAGITSVFAFAVPALADSWGFRGPVNPDDSLYWFVGTEAPEEAAFQLRLCREAESIGSGLAEPTTFADGESVTATLSNLRLDPAADGTIEWVGETTVSGTVPPHWTDWQPDPWAGPDHPSELCFGFEPPLAIRFTAPSAADLRELGCDPPAGYTSLRAGFSVDVDFVSDAGKSALAGAGYAMDIWCPDRAVSAPPSAPAESSAPPPAPKPAVVTPTPPATDMASGTDDHHVAGQWLGTALLTVLGLLVLGAQARARRGGRRLRG